MPSRPYSLFLKRCLDVAASLAGLALLLPVFAAVALAIKIDRPGPVFFRQIRVGRGGRHFRIVKFRSMVADASELGGALTTSGDERITRVGVFLRQTKLDELPQLFNVLGGSMSLVGPRPEVPQCMQFYTPEQRTLIQSMRPGMTDYAAIIYRDESALLLGGTDPLESYRREIMPRKFVYYEKYFHDIGVLTDIKIVVATVWTLVRGRVPRWLEL